MVAEIEEGVLHRDRGLSRRVSDAREALEKRLARADVRGFAHVLVAPEYKQGVPFAIQGLGFGGLEPNTVLLGWPRRNKLDFDEDLDDDLDDPFAEDAAKTLVETVCECTAAEKAVLLCLDPHAFPGSDERVSGYVDVWWVVHDGGLLLMIAHLRLRHRGGANLTPEPRPILYVSYAMRWFKDSVNFKTPHSAAWDELPSNTHRALLDRLDSRAYTRTLEKVLEERGVDVAELRSSRAAEYHVATLVV